VYDQPFKLQTLLLFIFPTIYLATQSLSEISEYGVVGYLVKNELKRIWQHFLCA